MSVLKRMTQPITAPIVLIVDDDLRVLELLEIAFQAHGFKVVKAADGDEAIHRIAGERPDLVVLDVRLPKKSGLEVCEIIRRDPTDARLPVIVMSGAAETESRLRAFTCGAHGAFGSLGRGGSSTVRLPSTKVIAHRTVIRSLPSAGVYRAFSPMSWWTVPLNASSASRASSYSSRSPSL